MLNVSVESLNKISVIWEPHNNILLSSHFSRASYWAAVFLGVSVMSYLG